MSQHSPLLCLNGIDTVPVGLDAPTPELVKRELNIFSNRTGLLRMHFCFVSPPAVTVYSATESSVNTAFPP